MHECHGDWRRARDRERASFNIQHPRIPRLTLSHAMRTLIFLKRKFHVMLLEHDEGVSVSCPELPGCHSQGANVEEALANIEAAIRGYIDLYGEPDTRCEIREMEVVTA
jgi:predicted RNase H-like HicB family nuclease